MLVEEIERVYLSECEAVEKEYNRATGIRPCSTLRFGAESNVLRFPMRAHQLKKGDGFKFTEAVVELALHDMVSSEDVDRLSGTAASAAGATVNICELKACLN